MRQIALLAMSALLMAAIAHAQSESPDCANAQSNVEMTQCAWDAYERADRELNDVYQDALAKIEQTGADLPSGAEVWEEKFRAAQRAWIAFRDADCQELVQIEWYGGSGAGHAIASCLTNLTAARTDDLRERYLAR